MESQDQANTQEDRRDPDQANAIGEGLAAGALPDAERRADEPPLVDTPPDPATPPIEEPPPEPAAEAAAEPEPEPTPEPTETEKKIARITEIIATVQKNCDPSDRHLLHELKDILFGGDKEGEEG